MSVCRRSGNWAKQVAVWLAISCLVPLLGYYITAAAYPPPDEHEYDRNQSELRDKRNESKDDAEKERLRVLLQEQEDKHHEAEKVFARRVFYVACPIGLLAFAIGIMVRVQAVGAGLMFGGLSTLTEGCYSAWDFLDRWTQLSSLIVCLVVIVALGMWKFRPPTIDRQPPERAA